MFIVAPLRWRRPRCAGEETLYSTRRWSAAGLQDSRRSIVQRLKTRWHAAKSSGFSRGTIPPGHPPPMALPVPPMKPLLACLSVFVVFAGFARAADPVDYVRQVKPILTRQCASCHGAIKPRAWLRLDTAEAA